MGVVGNPAVAYAVIYQPRKHYPQEGAIGIEP